MVQEWSSSDLTSLREVSSAEGRPSVSRKVTQLPQIVWLLRVGGSSGGAAEAVGRYTRRKGGKSCEVLWINCDYYNADDSKIHRKTVFLPLS